MLHLIQNNNKRSSKISAKISENKSGLKSCESYKYISVCNKSDIKQNKALSKTAMNSHSTTPHQEGQSNVKSSNHFMKIVDKFQNVFKKENSNNSKSNVLMKMSRSKPNLICVEDNFIWKKFEDRINNCNKFNSINSNDFDLRPNKPVRLVYGHNQEDIFKSKENSIEDELPQKYLIPNIKDSKESTMEIKPTKLEQSNEKWMKQTYKISSAASVDSEIVPKTCCENTTNRKINYEDKQITDMRCNKENSKFEVFKEQKLISQDNCERSSKKQKEIDYMQKPPIKSEIATKMKRFQKLEEEIAIYQQQINKLAKLREDSRKRMEFHNRKSEDSVNESYNTVEELDQRICESGKENFCPNKYAVDEKLNHYKRFI